MKGVYVSERWTGERVNERRGVGVSVSVSVSASVQGWVGVCANENENVCGSGSASAGGRGRACGNLSYCALLRLTAPYCALLPIIAHMLSSSIIYHPSHHPEHTHATHATHATHPHMHARWLAEGVHGGQHTTVEGGGVELGELTEELSSQFVALVVPQLQRAVSTCK